AQPHLLIDDTPTLHQLHPFPPRRSSDLVGVKFGVSLPTPLPPPLHEGGEGQGVRSRGWRVPGAAYVVSVSFVEGTWPAIRSSSIDRKSTRLNSSHEWISYAVFCLKKKSK